MTIFYNILIATFALSALSLIGAFAFFINEKLLKRIIFPMVALSAGALLGGAMLHMIPEAYEASNGSNDIYIMVLVGFSLFFLLEQFIHWHHCHRMPSEHKEPVTYLILIADGLHNFLGGLAIGSAFIIDTHLGVVTTFVAAAHEIPQELGDFGILVKGGWKKAKALLFNFLSGILMVYGGILAFVVSDQINMSYLLAFAAGNFIYISSSDLIPEIKHGKILKENLLHFLMFVFGMLIIGLVKH